MTKEIRSSRWLFLSTTPNKTKSTNVFIKLSKLLYYNHLEEVSWNAHFLVNSDIICSIQSTTEKYF